MVTDTPTTPAAPTWALFRDAGEPRPSVPLRADVVTAVLAVWFALGMFVDAWAHANLTELETFFTPWHAVFYSGFAATGCWVLWLVWQQLRAGRRGVAAIPLGYGWAVVALPAFAVSGAGDLLWHALLGIETSTDAFFSPSHLGLLVSMVLILTSPLRAAWARHPAGTRPAPGALLPAVLALAFAISLVLLFVSYANPLRFDPAAVVLAMTDPEQEAIQLFVASVLVVGPLLMAPLLLLARRWYLPPGAATAVFGSAALLTATVQGFEPLHVFGAVLAAGVLVDLLAAVLRPSAGRRTAYWLFGALAPLLVWSVFLLVSALTEGELSMLGRPVVPELWTGLPVVAGLAGWGLAALMMPDVADQPKS